MLKTVSDLASSSVDFVRKAVAWSSKFGSVDSAGCCTVIAGAAD